MTGFTKFSMKNVAALFIIILLLFGSGIYASSQLKVENMPNISFPVVVVNTQYTAAPKDVMNDVTAPIEEKLANIVDLDSMSSTSTDNFSTVIIMFKQSVDTDKKKQEIDSLLQGISLPKTAGMPKSSTFGASSFATNYMVAYADNGMSQTELDKLYKDTIEPHLQSLKGIDHIDVVGARDSSLDIELDANALRIYALSPGQVTDAITAALTKSPIGSVKLSGNDKMVRVKGDLQSISDLEQLEIRTKDGSKINLYQVAKIKQVTESKFYSRLDGKPAIGLILYKVGSANAVDFANAISKQTTEWKTTMPNVTFQSTYDSSIDIVKSINGLLREGLIGAILASLMILVFLRNVRMTLIVLVSLPLSILVTLLLMWAFNISLNTMSLGGIFIAIGRVVDDAIVVIENIYASLEKAQERKESVILLATKQVSSAITSSTLATVSVFAPIGIVSGIVGELFRPFAITIACALLSSLIVALTVIPMLAKLLVLRGKSIKAHDPHEEAKQGRFMSIYESVLKWTLINRFKTLLMVALVFIVTMVTTIPNLSMAFIPSGAPSKTMYFQIKLPNETSLDATNEKSKDLEKVLMTTKDSKGNQVFKFVEALVGYNGDAKQQTPYASQIYVEVNDNVDVSKVKNQVKDFILSELPKGSKVEPKELGGGGGVPTTDFQYSLKGDDQTQLELAAAMVKEKLQAIPGLSEIQDNLSDGKTEVEIAVDRNKATSYGLSAAMVRDTARIWIQKQSLGDLKLDNQTYTTTVSLAEISKDSIEKLGNIPFTSSTGTTIYLKDMAKISEIQSAVSLSRDNQKQLVKVTAKINAVDKSGISKIASAALSSITLPDGVSPELKGVSADISSSFSQLFMVMAIAVCIVYLIMVLAFGNATAPFAIMFSLPLAAIGGLIGLVVTGEALSITSMIGFMMLIGIVVTNAIVLIDRAQQLREDGYTVRHALLEAGKVRFRPIVMTAGATIMALVPLALGFSGEGALIGKGLGVVVIGGLFSSTVMTLIVVPIIYELIEGFKNRLFRMFTKENRHMERESKTLEI